jgi:hypothetical protein
MNAASSRRLEGRGAPRLLAHFVALERVTTCGTRTARARLEEELGLELTERLVGALSRQSRRRAPPALA